MREQTVTVYRSGEFVANYQKETCDRCASPGTVIFPFHVWLTVLSSTLNSQGFVIDHNVVASYFTDTWGSTRESLPSCERIACEAINFFCELIPSLVAARVQIFGDIAHVEARWFQERNPLPRHVPLVVSNEWLEELDAEGKPLTQRQRNNRVIHDHAPARLK